MRRLLIPGAALFGGLQLALLNPVIALLLAGIYDASPGEIGLILALMNTTGFASSVLIPAWADRRGEYLLPLFVCGALTLVTAILLALTTSLTVAGIVLVLIAGPAGTWSAMLFAHQRATGGSNEEVIRTRAVFSFAWVAGPPLAAGAIDGFGDRSVLQLIAIVAVANLVLTAGMQREQRRAAASDAGSGRGPEDPPLRRDSPADGPDTPALSVSVPVLVMVLIAMTALQAANAGGVSVLSLLVTQRLGFDATWAGLALGVCAILEIPALLLVGRLTRRFSSLTLLLAGTVLSALYYALVPFSPGVWALLALQLPNALGIAALSGVGLTWFQEVIDRPGMASGTFLNTRRVGAILSGPVIATGGAAGLGYATPFLIFAGLSVLALVGMLLARALEPRAAGDVPPPDAEAA